jgi:FtsP/CotA-like multicopper oxidase with cupredoxin domain
MPFLSLPAVLAIAAPLLLQDAVTPPLPRLPLPRPAAGAPLAAVNQNLVAAGRRSRDTLALALDVVEAAYQPEGPNDPVVRILALAERGKTPQVPGPLLRVPVGTTVRLSLRNRSDSALMFSGFRPALKAEDDTLQLAAGATRDITVRLDAVGTFAYWGVLKGLTAFRQRDWLDSQLSGAIVVDPAGATPRDRIFVVTEWFHNYEDRPFESALVFNGKAWPHNEQITLPQGDSVHWRLINLAGIEHPIHLHGFYYRMERQGGERGDSAIVPARDSVQVPGPVLELRRGQPVRLLVKNTMDEYTGVHWHGLEIESYPDGVPNFSGMGGHIMPPIAPGDSFAAEFTPPRSGTFPYHSHLNELRQIGSGMYGAILVTDGPRDTTRDHVIVAGGGGVPMFAKLGPTFLLVNGRVFPRPIHMTAGDTNRVRIVSIHSDEILEFRLSNDSSVVRWTPLARDGADLPVTLQRPELAKIEMGPGQTADFLYAPDRPGKLTLEVWIGSTSVGTRVAVPIIVDAPRKKPD